METRIQRKIIIEYYWNSDAGIEIPDQHEEALKEDAELRIFDQISEGFYSGDLCTSVRYGKDIVPQEDEEDGLSYSGWWNAKFT